MNKGEILAINISQKMGEPMEVQENVALVKDKGIQGDRYEKGNGAYSKAPRKNVPPELNQDRDIIRDVSLIAEEAIKSANQEFGTDFNFTDTRRNILVQGIEDLTSLIGVVFTIGGVAMLGIEACDPCDRPSKLSGKPGFNQAFQNRGGLRARVVSDGEIKVGDQILVENT
ncbi:MOSC domain-containing protein [Candidatus Woesebacteria bacterium]|nr:MOSC domain-containing protein [Candidatus Woesebacteria bacterium]